MPPLLTSYVPRYNPNPFTKIKALLLPLLLLLLLVLLLLLLLLLIPLYSMHNTMAYCRYRLNHKLVCNAITINSINRSRCQLPFCVCDINIYSEYYVVMFFLWVFYGFYSEYICFAWYRVPCVVVLIAVRNDSVPRFELATPRAFYYRTTPKGNLLSLLYSARYRTGQT